MWYLIVSISDLCTVTYFEMAHFIESYSILVYCVEAFQFINNINNEKNPFRLSVKHDETSQDKHQAPTRSLGKCRH